MTNPPPAGLEAAFDRWQEAQRAAIRAVLRADHPGTPTDWAEGFRWVTRMAALALDWIVEKGDPMRPVLFRCQDEHRKLLGDNPDVNYYFAPLHPGQRYRLWGNRGDAPYVGLTLGTDLFGRIPTEGRTGTLGQYHLDQFELADDGDFEIVLSAARPAERNWMRLEAGVGHLAVRETFFDRARTRAAVLRIERLGDAGAAAPLSPEALVESLDAAAGFLAFVVEMAIGLFAGSATSLNRLEGAPGQAHVDAQANEIRSHSDTDMVYVGGRWRFGKDEALVIEIRPPEYNFVYWGLAILNPWMETYDYRHRRTHINNGVARTNPDGSWTVVVAARDPGVPNWIDTGGRYEGLMLLRWVLAGDRPPIPECTVLPLSKLSERER